MTSPYEFLEQNGPQQWGAYGGGQPTDAARPTPAPGWGPAPAPQWGPATESGGPGGPGGTTRRGRRVRWPLRRGATLAVAVPVALLVALVAVLGFGWPGFLNRTVFDAAGVQAGVANVLRTSYQVDASEISCPPDQPVRAGTRFPCSVVVDGQRRTVTIVVRSDDGRFEVGRPQ
ncbi:DUF4333 domain-containing protein [Micromonospora sp. NPDC049559]|uniref:DUF4333 domain-containing protein n=1 Tax=Micromonospora sp. NPDC049559 TaxID=3155923 RepID=UPI00343623BD